MIVPPKDMSRYEIVEMRSASMAFRAAGHLHQAASLVGALWTSLGLSTVYGVHLGNKLELGVVLIGLPWVLYELLFNAVYYWRSDNKGLTMRSLFRHTFVQWCDVQSAYYSHVDCTRGIKTQKKRFVIPELGSKRGKDLSVSIWYHLTKNHVECRAILSDDIAESLSELPESTPRTMDWVNPHPPTIQPLSITEKVLLAIAGLLFAVPLMRTDYRSFCIILFTIGPILVLWFGIWWYVKWNLGRIAIILNVREDYFEAVTLRGKVIVPWKSVTSTCWSGDFFVLKCRAPRAVIRIPATKSSEWLFVSIAQYLRQFERHRYLTVSGFVRKAMAAQNRGSRK